MTRLSRQEQAAILRQAFATEQERAKTTAASLATMHPLFQGILKAHGAPAPIDPRDPDPSKPGIFRDHNCYKCGDGDRPCVRGNPRQCEFPHARND